MPAETLQLRRLTPRLDPAPSDLPPQELPARAVADLLAGMGLAGATALLALLVPGGAGPVSWVLAGVVVFVVPGYLLLEAAAPAPPGARARAERLLLSVGLSPAVVGLVALSTAVVPGGFKPAVIVMAVALACAGLGAAGIWRRQNPDAALTALLARLRLH